jgi:membrane-bound lytic murein transglycosylase D
MSLFYDITFSFLCGPLPPLLVDVRFTQDIRSWMPGREIDSHEFIQIRKSKNGNPRMMLHLNFVLAATLALLTACSTSAPSRPSKVATPSAISAPAAGSAATSAPQDDRPAQPAKHPRFLFAVSSADRAPSGPMSEKADEIAIEEEEDEISGQPPQKQAVSINRALALCRAAQAYWKRGEIDLAIETLDQAYGVVLSVDPGNDPELLQEMEDLRITISKRILEIYSSRNVVVNGKRNEIPITVNRHVQDEIDSFTTGRERDFFLEAYRRSGRYRSKIEAALKEAGLPVDLVWLPLIESGYKVTALSPARALGLWQFIPSTGYRYGLNRDTYIDERLNPEKSTRSAIEYLKELHGMFGDWTTVLAAYNCGENRVLRTIQSQNINYLDNFWDLYERLPRETARYVPRFLATLHIVQSAKAYGLDEIAVDPPLESEPVTIPRQVSLAAIAHATGIDPDLLRMLNAELRQGVLPEDGYDLRVPPGEKDQVLAKLEEIPPYEVRRVEVRRTPSAVVKHHKVRKDETIQAVASKYGTDVKTVMRANQLRRPAPLAAGTILRIPVESPPERSPTTAGPKTTAARREPIEHVVRQGDSLYNLAKRYGTTTVDIQRRNQVPNASLVIGQVLKIVPAADLDRDESTKARNPPVYVVRNGDTLHSIAKQHGMAVDRLTALNRLKASAKLQPGQKLIVEN